MFRHQDLGLGLFNLRVVRFLGVLTCWAAMKGWMLGEAMRLPGPQAIKPKAPNPLDSRLGFHRIHRNPIS